MVKYSIIFILVCSFTKSLFGQTLPQEYTTLIKKADYFYRVKSYDVSASTYSKAFKTIHWKVPVADRYNAACVWALAANADSAFAQLNYIATKMNYTDYEQITADHDLNTLYKDKRWKPLLEIVQQNKEKKEAKRNRPLIAELDTIYISDQKYRKTIDSVEQYGFDSKEIKEHWKTINKKDSINLIKVKLILDQYGWLDTDVVGKQGNTTLFLVIQHADLKTQEKYLPMMREAVKDGKADASALALLEDRVALRQGKKQIYGSQILQDTKTGKYSISPIEDEANVDKRRAKVGLEPLSEYVKHWGIEYKLNQTKESIPPYITNKDFETAIEIRDSIIGPVNVSRWEGNHIDFNLDYNCFNLKEENSAWFKFSVDYDTILTFDIVPENVKDDYDFVLFKCSNANTPKSKITYERFCFSQNTSKNSSTGLSEYAKVPYITAGAGFAYVSPLPIKAGEVYYLMVTYGESYWSYDHRIPKGFTIYFYDLWPKKPKKLLGKKSLVKKEPLNTVIVLDNVLFKSNDTILLKESFVALDKLVKQMQLNKTMKIEIRGHTDNTGNEIRNQQLSEERAKAVADYLISKNIDKNRLSSKGFGSEKPIASNDTEEGRKKNRKVEFVITLK